MPRKARTEELHIQVEIPPLTVTPALEAEFARAAGLLAKLRRLREERQGQPAGKPACQGVEA